MIKNIIFDFDGTIANTKEKIIEIVNDLGPNYGYSKLSKQEIDFFQSKGARWLINNLKIPKIKIPFLMNNIRSKLSVITKDLKPITGIPEALKRLKNNKLKLGILTTNAEDNVRKFLKNNKIEYFDFIYHGASLFGKDIMLKKMLNEQFINKEESIYIGDEDRDILAAKKAGLKSVGVCWGFNSKELLTSTKPDYVIENPAELIAIFK
jgi:phosphoglycolate phosphatase